MDRSAARRTAAQVAARGPDHARPAAGRRTRSSVRDGKARHLPLPDDLRLPRRRAVPRALRDDDQPDANRPVQSRGPNEDLALQPVGLRAEQGGDFLRGPVGKIRQAAVRARFPHLLRHGPRTAGAGGAQAGRHRLRGLRPSACSRSARVAWPSGALSHGKAAGDEQRMGLESRSAPDELGLVRAQRARGNRA